MTRKHLWKYLLICGLWLWLAPFGYGQSANDRIDDLSTLLNSLSTKIPGLNESTTMTFKDVPVSEYLRAIGIEHNINVYIKDTPDLLITTNLNKETVKNVFLFVCKEFQYEIQATGTILEFRPYLEKEEEVVRLASPLNIEFQNNLLSVDLKNDSLSKVIRSISKLTGKKILIQSDFEKQITAFLPPTNLDTALEALFAVNNLRMINQKKGYILLEPFTTLSAGNTPQAGALAGTNRFEVETFSDGQDPYLTIEAEQADLKLLLTEIFDRVGVGYLFYDDLKGIVSAKADFIALNDLVQFILKGTGYTFKEDQTLYLVGQNTRDWLMSTEIVKLKFRPSFQAIELIPGVELTGGGATQSQRNNINRPNNNRNPINNNFNPGNTGFNNQFNGIGNNGGQGIGGGGFSSLGGNNAFQASASLPPEIRRAKVGQVQIVEYPELNRVILQGPSEEIAVLKDFLLEIDRPVPMVRIEMVVVEVSKDRLLNTGVRAGRRAQADSTGGLKDLLPGVQYGLDGSEINRILGSIPALSPLGLLKKDFYLQLRAQESQGNLKVRMEPVLSMLNGREASLTIGQTQYFLLETTTSTSGAVNNFQQFTQRFDRIDANITLTLKPYISDNGIVTLDVLPDFTTPVGSFSADVPPTIATRRFVSTIRVKEGETVVLGGLNEEAITENREGIPWISRVPVLKWFTGNVQRTNLQSSLLIYITPTIYYN